MDRIEFVVWIDSSSAHDQRWYDRSSLDTESEIGYCYTCGFLLGETDEHLTITHTVCEHEVGPHICIPKVAIRSRLLLGEDEQNAKSRNDSDDCGCDGSCDCGLPGHFARRPGEGQDPAAGSEGSWAAVQASFERGTR